MTKAIRREASYRSGLCTILQMSVRFTSTERALAMPDIIRVNPELGIIELESFGVVSKEDIAESFIKLRQIIEEQVA